MQKKSLIPDWLYSARTDESEIKYFEDAYYKDAKYYSPDINNNTARTTYAKRLGYFYLKHVATRLHPLVQEQKILELGELGFTWRIIPNLLPKERPINAICAGAGTNITFELGLAALYENSSIYLLDPSPHAIRHVEKIVLPAAIRFLPIGLSNKRDVLKFHKPDKIGSGSLSVFNLNPGSTYFSLPVDSLANIMIEQGIDRTVLDILKFDIEGSEHDVVDDVIQQGIRPRQLMFEFDQPVPPWTMERTLKKLCAYGYLIVSIWGLNVLLIDGLDLHCE